MDKFEANTVNIFSKDKRPKFKSFKFKYKSFSNDELLEILEQHRYTDIHSTQTFFEVYTSNKVEGNTLTKGQTKSLLEGICQDESYRSQAEVIQLNRVINDNLIIKTPLTLDSILDLHHKITYNTLENSTDEGKLRGKQVYISNSAIIPPTSDKVNSLLKLAIDNLNNSKYTIYDIFIFKLDFVKIHPFMDGNGRLSRVLLNGMLSDLGYPRFILRNQDKGFYYDSIEMSIKTGNYKYWFRFMLLYLVFIHSDINSFLLDID